ncbi:MAG: hypothetical protein NWE92_10655 [Candidatus Bathyarchaeota archaeon]|nr:hypothetical protein [Candidatus Bathyarchaeota archaeon]
METEKFKLSTILYGLIVPVIVGLIIVAFPAVLRPALDGWFPAGDPMTGAGASPYAFLTAIFTHGFAQMVIFAIPIILGLVWNKWAGGASGFIMGTLLYLGEAGYNNQYTAMNYGMTTNLYADPSFIGNYIVGGILCGYIAGGLANGSMNFKRMLGAGLTAALVVGALQFTFNITVAQAAYMSAANPGYALFLAMLPMIILGIIAPIIAKVMTWYGLQPVRH